MHDSSHEYDLNGNLLNRTESGVTFTFTYDPLNRIQTASPFNEVYSYDNRGNRQTQQSDQVSNLQNAIYKYDSQNRLIEVTNDTTTVNYSYNGDGLLVGRTENGQTTRYYYDGTNVIAEGNVAADGTFNLIATYERGNGLIAREDASGTKAFFEMNGHGDVTELRDINGQVLNTYTYDIWGNPLNTTETVQNPFRYAGEYWDNSTHLQYLRARWYDPIMGRFINEDTYQGEKTDPLSLNLYTYVENNPLTNVDPTGHGIVDIGFLFFDAGNLIMHPSWENAGYFALDIPTFFDPTDISDVSIHAARAAKAAGKVEEANHVAEGMGDGYRLKLNLQLFGRMDAKQAEKAAEKLGYKKIKEKIHGQLVFKKGRKYISPDFDSHIGGVWKMAKSVKDLARKDTRMGTYDAKLNRIGG